MALVERDRTGGDCLHTGCVPTKALLEAAALIHAARRAREFGVPAPGVIDFPAVRRHVLRAQELAGEVDSPEALARDGVELIKGAATFVGPRKIEVDGTRLSAGHFVVATGAEPVAPPIDGLSGVAYDTNLEAVAWESLPRSLGVLGGGPIGVEFGQAMARFGVRVHVLEAQERLLPGEEPQASDVLNPSLVAEGIDVRTKALVSAVRPCPGGIELEVGGRRGADTLEVERLLVATGRKPRTEGLGLDAAGVNLARNGVAVDRQLRTTQRHIFAVGDVTGGPQFTHVAEDQARFVANLLEAKSPFGRRATWNGRVVPRVTYTDPEVAAVGLTEEKARRRYRGVRAWQIGLDEIDRAITMGRTDGFLKIVTAAGWPGRIPGLGSRIGDEIVGACLVAPHAGELLAPVVMAMRARLPAGLVIWNMQAYPTLSVGIRQALAPMFEKTAARPSKKPR